MKRCFGYVRVSTQKQGEGVSLDAQRDAIQAYSTRQGLIVVRWFEELETAAKSGRPAFNAMLRALHRGDAEGLVIHKIDRSARNFADWAKIGDLADRGIDVHFVTETLDFRSRGGRLTADIQAVIAADFIRNLREETVKGLRGRLKQGIWPFPAPPGYLNSGRGKLKTIDPVVGPFIRRTFELYASGSYSLEALMEVLRPQAATANLSRLVSKSMLSYVLGNPFYCGVLKLRRTNETFSGNHQALISVSLFEQARDVRAERTSKKVFRHRYAFPGLFVCAGCARAMVGEQQKTHIYYRCHTSGCRTKSIREEVIDEAVRAFLGRYALPVGDEHVVYQQVVRMMGTDGVRDLRQSFEVRLTHATTRLSRLTDALLDDTIDKTLFDIKRAEIAIEIARLRQQQEQVGQNQLSRSDVDELFALQRCIAAMYDVSGPFERSQILKLATSNRSVSGRSVVVEPSEWLQWVKNPVPRPSWLPSTIHNSNAVSAAEALRRVLKSPEVMQLREIMEKHRPRKAPR